MKSTKIILFVVFIVLAVSCHFNVAEKQTSIKGIARLATGKLVADYPLILESYEASLYGRGAYTTIQELKTDQKGNFSYSGLLKTGRNYTLSGAVLFYINGKVYNLDTLQNTSSTLINEPEKMIRVVPGQDYQLKFILSN